MAKKRTEQPAVPATMPVEAEPKTKPVRLDLAPELHRKLRVVAAEEGKSMSTFARDLVAEAVERLYGARGKS